MRCCVIVVNRCLLHADWSLRFANLLCDNTYMLRGLCLFPSLFVVCWALSGGCLLFDGCSLFVDSPLLLGVRCCLLVLVADCCLH